MISSRRNPLVRRLRKLATKEGRNEFASLLLEGTHLLQEALKTHSDPTEVIATREWLQQYSEMFKPLINKISIYEVTPSVLKAALTTVNPDGVASIFPLSSLPKPIYKPNFILVLDRIQDPGNLGSLFRTSLAADVQVIWLLEGVDPLNQKVLRSSSGALLHLPYERFVDSNESGLENLVDKLKDLSKGGHQIIGTVVPDENSSKSISPYWEINWIRPTVLLLGNEGSGLHSVLKDCCTRLVTLPHSQSVESLNVAAAAVPLLLERRRATISAEMHQKL